ncbi:MAG: SDR family NAD(P)-dependent oxidoreductase, partial [Candidatus Scalindua sp.]
NKTAIITGGGTGIGKASAVLFAKEGANVVICGRREQKLKEVKNAITKELGLKAKDLKRILSVSCDVSRQDDVNKLINKSIKQFKRIDILLNNAGVFGGPSVVHKQLLTDWGKVINTNLNGMFLLVKRVIPNMIAKGGGSIINVASILGMVAIPEASAYNASKGGVIMLTRSIAVEYGRHNIRANSICPGVVETPMTQGLLADKKRSSALLNLYPMGRFGKPEDIAYGCLYFASDESSWVTGTILTIDGGYTAM